MNEAKPLVAFVRSAWLWLALISPNPTSNHQIKCKSNLILDLLSPVVAELGRACCYAVSTVYFTFSEVNGLLQNISCGNVRDSYFTTAWNWNKSICLRFFTDNWHIVVKTSTWQLRDLFQTTQRLIWSCDNYCMKTTLNIAKLSPNWNLTGLRWSYSQFLQQPADRPAGRLTIRKSTL